jgi:hypothetical protein
MPCHPADPSLCALYQSRSGLEIKSCCSPEQDLIRTESRVETKTKAGAWVLD